jgi:hypothetical protein
MTLPPTIHTFHPGHHQHATVNILVAELIKKHMIDESSLTGPTRNRFNQDKANDIIAKVIQLNSLRDPRYQDIVRFFLFKVARSVFLVQVWNKNFGSSCTKQDYDQIVFEFFLDVYHRLGL